MAETATLEKTEAGTAYKKPPLFAVVCLNDDITTMEFVMKMLMEIFGKTPPDAERLMMDIHESGSGVAGVYIYDIALTKQQKSLQMAKSEGFPLKIILREA
ncbi:ATP-dependent Clp protease adapter protein ClpS [Clostridia bacterium]|nr:ATP-dependent Clp protease adapter protein ClpS [Clostridia bacterium]